MEGRVHRISRIVISIAAACFLGRAEIIDRVAIIVGHRAIKQSDIEREIRIVSFLNGTMPDFSPTSQKGAASRLIDQLLIRQEIQTTGAAPAAMSEAERLLEQIKKERFPNESKFREALARYGTTEAQLKSALLWQLTVLRFIAQRFTGSVGVSDEELERYFNSHRTELTKAHPEAHSANDLRSQIEAEISDERVNQQFEAWLDQGRKDARIDYREEHLR